MALSEEEFHRFMSDEYSKQQRTSPEPAPRGVDSETWKNRHLVSAKLPPGVYADLMAFCRKNGMSVNSALRAILHNTFNSTNV